ncbi:MAG: RloB domain-containing protein, partial [Candidatus Omnitrophica bacterium]|nr:RloB domain-containing protein [Candidatus Omnitrophota bacterium]
MSSFRGRKRKEREPLSTLYIVCEGKKTEPLYFENYRTRENNVKIKTVTCSSKDAIGIVDFAITKIKRGDFSVEDNDEVVCVFDCDKNEDDALEKAFKKARENKIKICLSNPFFELWFLLHNEYDKQPFTKEKLESR